MSAAVNGGEIAPMHASLQIRTSATPHETKLRQRFIRSFQDPMLWHVRCIACCTRSTVTPHLIDSMEDAWPSWRETAMTDLRQMFEPKLALSTGEPWVVSPRPSGARANLHAALGDREWELAADATPPLAAHVVTSRIGYTHHGIHVGNGNVVHYSGLSRAWRGGPVEEVSLAEFARGRPIRVRVHADARFDRDEVVARAQSRLGENRYRALSNNCEHLCEWCVYGENRSRQVEVLRYRWGRAVRTVWRVVSTPVRLVTQLGSGARRRTSVRCSEA